MAHRKTPLVRGEYFHIYNRGNSKKKIFLDDKDRSRFIKLLYISNSQKRINFRDDIVDAKINAWDFEKGDNLVSIGAWVLMPNHFHLYLISPIPGLGEMGEIGRNNEKDNNITLFMNKLCVSYSKYFNKKYNRSGSLFEGPFKSTHLNNNNQAKYIFSYIHLNPVKLIQKDWKEKGINNKQQALDFLKTYTCSSYLDYLGHKRVENSILNRESFPDYFPTKEKFLKEIFEWLSYGELT